MADGYFKLEIVIQSSRLLNLADTYVASQLQLVTYFTIVVSGQWSPTVFLFFEAVSFSCVQKSSYVKNLFFKIMKTVVTIHQNSMRDTAKLKGQCNHYCDIATQLVANVVLGN